VITELIEAGLFVPEAVNPLSSALALAPRMRDAVKEDPSLPRVCIVGAGPAGIALARQLYAARIPFDCFEQADRIGGLWAFQSEGGVSRAYRSLHTITSRDRNAYADFPFPRDYPDFPHHRLMERYFNAYVDWFGFRHKITLGCAVTRARQDERGLWHVTLETGETRTYDVLCPAVGQYWSPRWPDPHPPGHFDGLEIHSSQYVDPRNPMDFRGRKVVVVGFGNSALDIACELSRKENCDAAYLSVRHGVWVVPRHFGPKVWDAGRVHVALSGDGGKPKFTLRSLAHKMLPGLGAWLRLKRLEAAIGLPHQVGLPIPPEPWSQAQAAISTEFNTRVKLGDLKVVSEIVSFDGRRVNLKDGENIEADAVIWCTGYNRKFTFFDGAEADAIQDSVSLWMQIVHPTRPNLFHVGCVSAACAAMPLAEQQALFITDMVLGRFHPPSPRAMQAELAEARQLLAEGKAPDWYAEDVQCNAYVAAIRRVAKEAANAADRSPAVLARAKATSQLVSA